MRRIVGNMLKSVLTVRGTTALARRGVWQYLRKRPEDAIAPDAADLWYLYRVVRRLKPRVVVEFGSGCSTLVMAWAMLDTYYADPMAAADPGILYSVETDRRWLDVTQDMLPPAMQRVVSLKHSEIEIIEMPGGEKAWRHSTKPMASMDFLYLDGPPLSPQVNASTDPIEMEACFRPGFAMLVDDRRPTVALLRDHLSRPYHVQRNRILGSTLFTLQSP